MMPGCNLEAAVTPRATQLVLDCARPSAEVRHTRSARNPLPEFCAGLKVRNNVIVRIAKEERESNPDEEYFVAKIEGKTKQIKQRGVYSAVQFEKGDWIVSACWYICILSVKDEQTV